MVLQLIQNAAFLVALAAGLQILARRLLRRPLLYGLTAGVMFGAVCVAGMMTPMHFSTGVIYDARSVILSLAGLFGGPMTAGIAGLMAAAYRIFLGGAGALPGVLVVVESAGLGVGLHYLRKRDERWVSWPRLWAFGLLVHAAMLTSQLTLPTGEGWQVMRRVGPPVMLFYPLGFLLVAQLFLDGQRRRKAEQQLHESEAIRRAMISCSPLALYSIDLNGNVITWNESAERIFGWRADEVVGKPLPVVPPYDQEEAAAFRDRVRAGEAFTGLEVTRMRKDGTHFSGSLAVAPLRDESGEPIGLFAALEDITERKRAESALREREERYRSLFENNHAVMLLIDPQTQAIVDGNPAAVRFYGYKREDLITMPISEISMLGDQRLREELARTKTTGKNYFHSRHRLADGSIRDTEIYSGPISVEGRDLVYSIVHDITDQKVAEATLRENEERFRTLVEAAPDAICLQADRKFAYVNSAALELFGVTRPEELIGTDVLDRFHPSSRPLVVERINRLNQEKKKVGLLEEICLRVDGTCVPVEASAVPTTYRGKDGAIVFLRDISERKKLQEQLAESQKLEAVGRLAGGVAHDFNNMLQVILSYSEMLLGGTGPGHPFHESLAEIHKAGTRSAELTRQLLAFARKQTISPKLLDMSEVVTDGLKMLQRLIGEDIDLLWQPCTEPCRVMIDPAQVDQMLVNLVVNSRDAIPGVGKITIETAHAEFDAEYCENHPESRVGRFEMLAVSDNGVGMDHRVLTQVFEPFFTTKGRCKGTGLGLATVYGIVKQNQGFVNVYSEPGQGTTIRIYLPAAQTQGTPQYASAESSEPPTGSETVLLVEDEPALLDLSHRILQRLGYCVLPALGAEDAILLADEHHGHIDVLITDVVMPQMSGRDLWQHLIRRHKNLPCLFMSGYTDNVIAHHGVLDPGVHFLQKPFSMGDLARKVREALDSGNGRGRERNGDTR